MIVIGDDADLTPLFHIDIMNPSALSDVFRKDRLWTRVTDEDSYRVGNELPFENLDI